MMLGRKTALLMCGGSLLLLLTIWMLADRGEHYYKGRSLTYWVSILDRKPSPNNARAAILAIGTNGIPNLLELVQFRGYGMVSGFESLLREINDSPAAGPWQMPEQAGRAIGLFGTNAAFVIPDLWQIAAGDYGTSGHVDALIGIGPPALPSAWMHLTNSSIHLQETAIPVVVGIAERYNLPTELDRSLPHIIAVLNERSNGGWTALVNALNVLEKHPKRPDLAVPALIGMLDEKNNHLRGLAIQCLGNYGADALPALPQLRSERDRVALTDKREAAAITVVIEKIEKFTAKAQRAERNEETTILNSAAND